MMPVLLLKNSKTYFNTELQSEVNAGVLLQYVKELLTKPTKLDG